MKQCWNCTHWKRKTDKTGDCQCHAFQFDARSVIAQPGLSSTPETDWDFVCEHFAFSKQQR